jgi:hypothetical protein
MSDKGGRYVVRPRYLNIQRLNYLWTIRRGSYAGPRATWSHNVTAGVV